MSKELIGTVFGVEIHRPISRAEVRELAKERETFITSLMEEKQLNQAQASLDASDIFIEFCSQLSEAEKESLELMLQEESAALVVGQADEYSKKAAKDTEADIEAAQSHIQAQFIFDQLSANLQVYGTNSSLTAHTPANVDLALQHINRSLEIHPNNAAYLNLKGLLLWQGKGDKAAALPFIKKASQLAPNDINIQHNLKAIQDPNGCFIATASFGTPLAYEINELRYWRDTALSKSVFGKAFIKTYYKLSPPVANFIATKPMIKKITRNALKPLIAYARKVNGKH